jgi:hypothetical protein
MSSEEPIVTVRPDPGKGLPPVAPPSGRFIAQLFLVPGLIVAVAVLLLVGFNYLVSGANTPEYYLKQLDNPNADVRWRGASDLAQVLKRKESQALRSDAKFALDLAERLRTALDDLYREEKATGDRVANLSTAEQNRAWRKLAPQRDHVQYLAAALGDFVVPVGVPLLAEIALRDQSLDVEGNTLRRRQAVWALGNLGDKVRSFTELPEAQQDAIRARLQAEAKGEGKRADWALNAWYYLEPGGPQAVRNVRQAMLPGLLALNPWSVVGWFGSDVDVLAGIVEVDRVLARVARAEDRYLRAQVALALNFWDGDLVEPTLLLLARDTGHGQLLRVSEPD